MSAAELVLRTPGHIGRFELKRMLGQGAQATVWLAHDPRLDRVVALKCLEPGAGTDIVDQWLREARAVSRLSHPNIVPVFEADQQDGATYLVFEFIAGGTLADAMRTSSLVPAQQAVHWMLGVLDALTAAHRQGIVHRDLKPSNVLIDADGRARVMDFGIAARLSDGAAGRVAGTPGYLSPEGARGEAPGPGMDLFAAGAMLGELLCGTTLLDEPDTARWLQRVQVEDLILPALGHVDDRLRAIVHRAVARDVQRRYDSAQAMRQALTDWLHPEAAAQGAAGAVLGSGHGTLEFLLRRMRHQSDFPALSESVLRIQQMASSDSDSLSSLCAEILKDVALTNKLLRLVNTAQYGTDGNGGISTVSRAVSLVGFAGIRNMALSLLLLEHMQNRAHAEQLQQEFLRALMAGTLASELAAGESHREQVFLGAMFQGLGRLLTEYYLPEEAQQIRRQAPASTDSTPAQDLRRREAVARKVLGLSFETLGLGVAHSWGLPEALQQCMRLPEGEPPQRAAEGMARQRWQGACANAFTEALIESPPAQSAQRLHGVAERHAPALAMSTEGLLGTVAAARERLAGVARALNLHIAATSPAHRLLPASGAQGLVSDDGLSPHRLQATIDKAQALAPSAPLPTADQLAAGMQDVTQALLATEFNLNEVLRMVLETMYRALNFRRVVFCLRDAASDTLTGRFSLGAEIAGLSANFRVPMRSVGSDLFAAVCQKGVDTLIANARQPNVAARLPAWYRQHVDAGSFLLLPMALKGTPFALIYADSLQPDTIRLDDKELSLLRALRNQAVMAFRQGG